MNNNELIQDALLKIINSDYLARTILSKQKTVRLGTYEKGQVVINNLKYSLGNDTVTPLENEQGLYIVYLGKAYYIQGLLEAVNIETTKDVNFDTEKIKQNATKEFNLDSPKININGKTTLKNNNIDLLNAIKDFSNVGAKLTGGAPPQNAIAINLLKAELVKLNTALNTYLN